MGSTWNSGLDQIDENLPGHNILHLSQKLLLLGAFLRGDLLLITTGIAFRVALVELLPAHEPLSLLRSQGDSVDRGWGLKSIPSCPLNRDTHIASSKCRYGLSRHRIAASRSALWPIEMFFHSISRATHLFQQSLGTARAKLSVGQSRPSCGYLYIVFGDNFYKEACLSLLSLRRFTQLPAHIITNTNQEKCIADGFSSALVVNDFHPRSKVDYIHLAPYDHAIYLDSDIIIKMPIDEIFEILCRYDIAAAVDVSRKKWSTSQKIDEYASIPYCFPEVNSGLLAFNAKTVRATLSAWRTIYYQYRSETDSQDQPSLRIALWQTRASLYLLPSEYNVRSKDLLDRIKAENNEFGPDHMKPRVHHLHYSLDIHRGIYAATSLAELEEATDSKVYSITY